MPDPLAMTIPELMPTIDVLSDALLEISRSDFVNAELMLDALADDAASDPAAIAHILGAVIMLLRQLVSSSARAWSVVEQDVVELNRSSLRAVADTVFDEGQPSASRRGLDR